MVMQGLPTVQVEHGFFSGCLGAGVFLLALYLAQFLRPHPNKVCSLTTSMSVRHSPAGGVAKHHPAGGGAKCLLGLCQPGDDCSWTVLTDVISACLFTARGFFELKKRRRCQGVFHNPFHCLRQDNVADRFLDSAVNVPVVLQRLWPTVQTVQNIEKFPALILAQGCGYVHQQQSFQVSRPLQKVVGSCRQLGERQLHAPKTAHGDADSLRGETHHVSRGS